jgi:16S rRNA (adenine1518-N6/adenine1519-N6)-dimethyltransferase
VERETGRAADTASARQLRALLDRRGFRPRKSLGQTFLVDGNIVRKIVETAQISRADSVVEIGAGAGAVTGALVEAAGRVVAIEIDPVLVDVLREVVADRAEIMLADVLEVAWPEALGASPRGQWKVVANLPYSITGPAILRLLEARDWLARLVIMVQREVAERLVAQPGERARGQLSVLVQAACEVRVAGQVSRNCFWPRPKVDSSILALEVRRPALVRPDLEPVYRQLVQAAFATRRKTVLNALAHGRGTEELGKELVRLLLERCGIAPGLRAEDLGTEDFLRLAEAMADWRKEQEA